MTRFPITGLAHSALKINQTRIALITTGGKKKRQRPRMRIFTENGELRLVRLIRASPRLSANLARDLHGSFTSPVCLSLPLFLFLSGWARFFSALPVVRSLFAASRPIGKIARPGEKAKLTPDAMPETRMQPEKKKCEAGYIEGKGWRRAGRSSRQVIERCAPLSSLHSKKFESRNDECAGTRNRVLEYVPRSSTTRSGAAGGQQNVSSKGISRS